MSTESEQKVAHAAIAEKSKQISALLDECESIADEHEIDFHAPWDIYGMGGWYNGGDKDNDDKHGWRSSSSGC